MSMVDMLVPASSAAERTSECDVRYIRYDIQQTELTVVLRPEGEVSSSNDILKEEPYYRPGYKIDSSGRWYITGSRKDDTSADFRLSPAV